MAMHDTCRNSDLCPAFRNILPLPSIPTLLLQETASLKLGVFTGALKPGQVYSGGSSDAFCKYTGAKGKVW